MTLPQLLVILAWPVCWLLRVLLERYAGEPAPERGMYVAAGIFEKGMR